MNKWQVIFVMWSNKGENLSNCWSNGVRLMTFTMGNLKCFDHCFIGDLGKTSGLSKTHLMGCIDEIIDFHRSLTDKEILHIHEYLMRKSVVTNAIISY